jgi:hypothetical protein
MQSVAACACIVKKIDACRGRTRVCGAATDALQLNCVPEDTTKYLRVRCCPDGTQTLRPATISLDHCSTTRCSSNKPWVASVDISLAHIGALCVVLSNLLARALAGALTAAAILLRVDPLAALPAATKKLLWPLLEARQVGHFNKDCSSTKRSCKCC